MLAPEAVADEAAEAFAESEHPLPPWFTFDPELAFHKLHVIEARSVISSISVVRPEAQDRRPVRAYVSIQNDGRPEYRRIDHVVQDRDMRQQLLVEVQEEQQRAQDKFAELMETVGAPRDVAATFLVKLRQGRSGLRNGNARLGMYVIGPCFGWAWPGRQGVVRRRHGTARSGTAGQSEARGLARQGLARQAGSGWARLGGAGLGEAGHGSAGTAGEVWHVWVRPGMAVHLLGRAGAVGGGQRSAGADLRRGGLGVERAGQPLAGGSGTWLEPSLGKAWPACRAPWLGGTRLALAWLMAGDGPNRALSFGVQDPETLFYQPSL